MAVRNAAKVLPDPVGAAIRTFLAAADRGPGLLLRGRRRIEAAAEPGGNGRVKCIQDANRLEPRPGLFQRENAHGHPQRIGAARRAPDASECDLRVKARSDPALRKAAYRQNGSRVHPQRRRHAAACMVRLARRPRDDRQARRTVHGGKLLRRVGLLRRHEQAPARAAAGRARPARPARRGTPNRAGPPAPA